MLIPAGVMMRMSDPVCRVLGVLALTICLGFGCKTMDELKAWTRKLRHKSDYKPEFVISIHHIVKKHDDHIQALERRIKTFSGKNIWVNVNSYLHSRDITEIEMIERPREKLPLELADYKGTLYDLRLHPTRRGMRLWLPVSVDLCGEKMAFMVDGIFYRTITPEKVIDEEKDETILIEGPFDEFTAKNIVERAKDNFDYYSDD